MKAEIKKIEWSYIKTKRKRGNHYQSEEISGIGIYTIFCEAHQNYVTRNEKDEEIFRSKSRYKAKQAGQKDIISRLKNKCND